MELKQKALFNANGDIDLSKRSMINGNTTNLNDFNNVKYDWTSRWYRQAMNNFWIPEEINLAQDIKDYRNFSDIERTAFDKILSFLVFLDSLQTANLPNIGAYITANEVNLCLTIQAFQEAVHSQSYSYMLDTICPPQKRNEILYQWKNDEHLLRRNEFIGNLYNDFLAHKDPKHLVKTLIANYILEGIYFYSDSCFSITWDEWVRFQEVFRKFVILTAMKIRICGYSETFSLNFRRNSLNFSLLKMSENTEK